MAASFLKPFRLGYGNKPESSQAEKPLLPSIEFWSGGSVFSIVYDGVDANAYRDGVFLGTLPGSGGGSGTAVLPMVTGEVPPVLVYFDDGSLLYAPASY